MSDAKESAWSSLTFVLLDNQVPELGIAGVADPVFHVRWTIQTGIRFDNFRLSVQIEFRLSFEYEEELVLRVTVRGMSRFVRTDDAHFHRLTAGEFPVGEPVLTAGLRSFYLRGIEFIHAVVDRVTARIGRNDYASRIYR